MQVVKNIFLGLIVFWFSMILFMPKQEIYYALESELIKEGIEINETTLDEGLFTLKARGVTIYVQGIKVAKIEKVRFFTLLFYTSVKIDGVVLDEGLSSFMEADIERTVMLHTLLSPLKVFITSMGSFGLAEGEIDLKQRKVRINLTDVKKIGSLKRELTRDKKGWYYETSF